MQEIKTTTGSVLLAIAWSIIDYIERDALENDVDPRGYLIRAPELERALEGFSSRLPRKVRVGVSPYPGDYSVELYNGVIVVFEELDGDGLGYEAFVNSVYRLPFIYDKGVIRGSALITSSTGTEYMFLYLSDGRLVHLEGARYKVSIPFLKNTVSSLHTHPEGSCMLSYADVDSALDSLVNGSILSGAATSRCAVILRRKGILTEDDYVELKRFSNFLRKKSDRRTLETRIYELKRKLSSVVLEAFNY